MSEPSELEKPSLLLLASDPPDDASTI
jgi:hypothetical protein